MSNPWRTAFFVPLSVAFLWLIALCFAPLFTSISFAQAGSKTLIGALNFLLVWGWFFLLIPPCLVGTWLVGRWYTDAVLADATKKAKQAEIEFRRESIITKNMADHAIAEAEEKAAEEIARARELAQGRAEAEAEAKYAARFAEISRITARMAEEKKNIEEREKNVNERENKIKTYLAEKDKAEKSAAKWKGWFEATATRCAQAAKELNAQPPNVGYALKILARKQRLRKRS